MTGYRESLPQLGGRPFLTDGGIETTLIFHDGLELPHFAAFHLLATGDGKTALHRYFAAYAELARRFGVGVVLESPTWRASGDWGARLGYTGAELAEANRAAIGMLEKIGRTVSGERVPVVISGCLGPRGDGYVPDPALTAADAESYHRAQIETFADTAADMVCALTLGSVAEAIGITRAARGARMPVAISFTLETDGSLPGGPTLEAAIADVDAATEGYPSYYMINCAHPTHFAHILEPGGAWTGRIRGVRANASRMSHAELNEAAGLDAGDPVELAGQYAELKSRLPRLSVLGGCCGTDVRHVEAIATRCLPLFAEAD